MNYRETIGTKENPLTLKTPPGSSEYTMHVEEKDGNDILVCTVGKTKLHYDIRCLQDLHEMLKAHGDWMPLGNADEGKPTKAGTLEHWARWEGNPVGGYYGLRKGYRGRFANYVAPTLELLGLVELEHNARNNRVRAV